MTNNTGKKCIRCGKGHYKIFDLNDEIFGDLHCDNCRHYVKFNQDLGIDDDYDAVDVDEVLK